MSVKLTVDGVYGDTTRYLRGHLFLPVDNELAISCLILNNFCIWRFRFASILRRMSCDQVGRSTTELASTLGSDPDVQAAGGSLYSFANYGIWRGTFGSTATASCTGRPSIQVIFVVCKRLYVCKWLYKNNFLWLYNSNSLLAPLALPPRIYHTSILDRVYFSKDLLRCKSPGLPMSFQNFCVDFHLRLMYTF